MIDQGIACRTVDQYCTVLHLLRSTKTVHGRWVSLSSTPPTFDRDSPRSTGTAQLHLLRSTETVHGRPALLSSTPTTVDQDSPRSPASLTYTSYGRSETVCGTIGTAQLHLLRTDREVHGRSHCSATPTTDGQDSRSTKTTHPWDDQYCTVLHLLGSTKTDIHGHAVLPTTIDQDTAWTLDYLFNLIRCTII